MLFDQEEDFEKTSKAIEEIVQSNGTHTEKDSKKTISQNVVKLCFRNRDKKRIIDGQIQYWHNTGTGLLLTSTGVIVTSYHTIKNHLNTWQKLSEEPLDVRMKKVKEDFCIQDRKGNRYPIDITFSGNMPPYDLTIIKAMIDSEGGPNLFNFQTTDPVEGEKITMEGYQSGKLTKVMGHVITPTVSLSCNPGNDLYDSFQSNVPLNYGLSGAPCFNDKGELVGIGSTKITSEEDPPGTPGKSSLETKAKHIFNLVKNFGDNYFGTDLSRLP